MEVRLVLVRWRLAVSTRALTIWRMMRLPSTNQLSTNRLSTKLQHSVAAPLFFYSLQDGRGGAFRIYRYGRPNAELGIKRRVWE